MNISVSSIAAAMALPVLMAMLFIWKVRREQSALTFVVAFFLGGFVSFVLAGMLSRLLLPVAVPFLLHGLYDTCAFLIEYTEFPELPDEPALADLKPLVWVFCPVVVVTLVGLAELIWAGIIIHRLRKGTPVQPREN